MTGSEFHEIAELPLGVADAEVRFGCVERPDRTVVCLDLHTGDRVTESTFPCHPIWMDEQHLIAWGVAPDHPNVLRLLSATVQSAPMEANWFASAELPSWVLVDDPDPRGFALDVIWTGVTLRLDWTARALHRGGAPPLADGPVAGGTYVAGSITIDLEELELSSTTAGELTSPAPALPARAPDSLPYLRRQRGMNEPWRAAAATMSLHRGAETGAVRLERLDARAGGEPRSRDLDVDLSVPTVVTPDGRHILAPGLERGRPVWRVWRTVDGEFVVTLPRALLTVDASVLRSAVFVVNDEPRGAAAMRSLSRYDIESGELAWSEPLGELTTQAPPPPP